MNGDPFISEVFKEILNISHKMWLQIFLQQRKWIVFLLMKILQLQTYLSKELLILHKLVILINCNLLLKLCAKE